MKKRLSASEQLQALQASGVDYVLLAIACFIPIFRSGDSLQMRATGLILGLSSVFGLLISFIIRRSFGQTKLSRAAVYAQLATSVLIGVNILKLNAMLPDGGFPWQLMNTAYLSFLLVGCSVFIWTDGTMFFQLVPGIALFGILSWLETGTGFEIWLVVFMASVAVLLTRLHTRSMIAIAFAAGAESIDELRQTNWKSMAGPLLAISSVCIIALVSHFISPTVGNTIRSALGNPDIRINLRPPNTGPSISQEPVDQRVGLGPATASNLELLKVTAPPGVRLIRRRQFIAYRGAGWTAPADNEIQQLQPSTIPKESNIPNAKVYEISIPVPMLHPVSAVIQYETINRSFVEAPVVGYPQRVEYDGDVRLLRRQILVDDGIPHGKQFWVKSVTSDPSPDDLRAVKNLTPSAAREQLRSLDNNRWAKRVVDLANQLGRGKRNDYDKVMAFMQEIARRCKYNLKADRITGDDDRVEAFLFDTHEGYCDLFASALAVMCRTQGIQARMVTGFWLDPNSMENGKYIVRDRHAHAWTEVYFEGYGFVPFDPSAIADVVPGGGMGDLLQDEEGWLTATRAMYAAGGVVGVLVLLFVGAQLLSFFRSTRKLPVALRKLRPAYKQFLKEMRGTLQRPRMQAETLSEYVNHYCERKGDYAALEVCHQIERILYVPNEAAHQEAETVREAVKRFLDYQRHAPQKAN